MFLISVISALVLLGMLVLAVLSFSGAYVNPFVDPGM